MYCIFNYCNLTQFETLKLRDGPEICKSKSNRFDLDIFCFNISFKLHDLYVERRSKFKVIEKSEQIFLFFFLLLQHLKFRFPRTMINDHHLSSFYSSESITRKIGIKGLVVFLLKDNEYVLERKHIFWFDDFFVFMVSCYSNMFVKCITEYKIQLEKPYQKQWEVEKLMVLILSPTSFTSLVRSWAW